MPRPFSLLFLFTVWSALAFAQGSSAAPAQLAPLTTGAAPPSPEALVKAPAARDESPADYSREGIVVQHSFRDIVFEADGTGTREAEVSLRIESQAGLQQFAILKFTYLSSGETVDFDYIRVRKPDGTVIVTPASNILDIPAEVTRLAPIYSDTHEKHVTVKGIAVGDVLEWLVRYHIFKPQVPGQFWFDHSFHKDLVILDGRLRVTVPRDKYVKIVSPDYKPEITEDHTSRTYLWKFSNLTRQDTDTSTRNEAVLPNVQVTTFRNWDEVGRWYNELQGPQLTVPSPLQARTAELTKGLSSDEDKVRVLYEYVSEKFHYVSLSFGVGRYQPHSAADVFENGYGDCKDKHTLLAAMLKAAGIEAWPALMNSEDEVDPDMPSPGQFDHVITYIPNRGKPIWLDTTPEVAPFGMLLGNLRNKLALVVPDHKVATLMRTPADLPFVPTRTFTVEGKLDGQGVLTAHIQQSARGDVETYFRLGFRGTAPANWNEVAQEYSVFEGFGGEVRNVAVSPPDDIRKPFEFSYDYTRKNFGEWPNHRLTSPLPPLGIERDAIREKKPAKPEQIGWIGELLFTAKLELPLDVIKLPTNVTLSEHWADFESSYTLSGRTLTVTRHFKAKQNEVALEQWDQYQQFAKSISDDERAWIYLGVAPAANSSSQDPSQTARPNTETQAVSGKAAELKQPTPAVAKKLEHAMQAVERDDTTTAEEIVRNVIRTDPDTPHLHALLGLIYAKRDDENDAIREFITEEELNPDEPEMYKGLAAAYEDRKEYGKEEDQFRKWLARDPKNLDAMIGLDDALSHQKKTVERVALWEQAVTMAPDSATVRRSLALAYLANRQTEKAIPLLQESLVGEPNPMLFNDAACALADENVHLETAQEWGQKALIALETESLKTDSEEAALTNASQIGAVWDTMGWVYFRLGELEKAELFLRAAFVLTQSTDAGDHLGQLYEKQRKKEAAAHQYLLAIASADSMPKDQVRKHYSALTGKNILDKDEPPRLSRSHGLPTATAGHPESSISPGEELSRARTTKITPTAHENGSANLSIVFSPGKIEDVKFLSGNEKLKSMVGSILASKLRAEFPGTDAVRLTRRGIMFCNIVSCEITLLLPNDAQVAE